MKNILRFRFVAKQAVKSALSDSRQLLKFAILSLIESLRTDPTKFNFLIHGMSSTVNDVKINHDRLRRQ